MRSIYFYVLLDFESVLFNLKNFLWVQIRSYVLVRAYGTYFSYCVIRGITLYNAFQETDKYPQKEVFNVELIVYKRPGIHF